MFRHPAVQPVLADTRHKAPFFPDQDAEMEGDQTDQELSVAENVLMIGTTDATEPVSNICAFLAAMDFVTTNA